MNSVDIKVEVTERNTTRITISDNDRSCYVEIRRPFDMRDAMVMFATISDKMRHDFKL